MYRVLTCLAMEHDYRLVVLAVLVGVATAMTTFLMYATAHTTQAGRMFSWAALTGICAGAGIWATHFVAMLAYQSNLPTNYEPVATMASLLIAIGLAACGFVLAAGGKLWMAILGGLVIGGAIGTTHYAGMSALSIPGRLEWDPTLVVASLVLGSGISGLAMLAFHFRSGISAILSAAALLTLAICTLHFTAMGAVTVVPDPTIVFLADNINRENMAAAVVAVMLIVLMSGTAAVVIQKANDRFESKLRQQNALFESVLRYLPVGLSVFDRNHRLIMCNPAYGGLHKLSESASLPGTTFSEFLLDQIQRDSQADAKERVDKARTLMADHFSKLDSGGVSTDTVRLNDGRTILKRVGPIEGGGWVDVEEDVTAIRLSDERIEWLAHHDTLTGIANRHKFRHLLERQFECYSPRLGFALHWIDLDGFKKINDEFGHPVGDALLKSVAGRLATSLRVGDVVGRIGGDEFAILQINVDGKDVAEAFAARILKAINQPHDALGHKFSAGASIGIALAPEHGQNADQLFASADVALYQAKSEGRGAAVTYVPGANAIEAPNPLRKELVGAVERNEFILHYQPIVDLRRGAATCFEGLIRWKHPTRGMISPSEFVPLAEDSRQIFELGRWALNRACTDAAQWQETLKVSINISSVQVGAGDIYQVVKDALENSGLDPQRLQIEITEAALKQDQEHARAVLNKLDDLGVTLVLDDFGACFASLSYLRGMPFKKIKIDGSFVRDVPARRDCVAILHSAADLARELRMNSIAEGVETASNLAAVRAAGYEEAQGFYFSVPVPAHVVSQAVAQCAFRLGKDSIKRNSRPKAAA